MWLNIQYVYMNVLVSSDAGSGSVFVCRAELLPHVAFVARFVLQVKCSPRRLLHALG